MYCKLMPRKEKKKRRNKRPPTVPVLYAVHRDIRRILAAHHKPLPALTQSIDETPARVAVSRRLLSRLSWTIVSCLVPLFHSQLIQIELRDGLSDLVRFGSVRLAIAKTFVYHLLRSYSSCPSPRQMTTNRLTYNTQTYIHMSIH